MMHTALDARTASEQPASELERELLKRLESGRTALPMLPQVAALALRLAGDRNANVSELASLVETDPPIAARFLSIANSAIYWRGIQVLSTQTAIVRLGLARTRDLLFQIVYANATVGLKRFQTEVRGSFERSVRSAQAARITSSVLGAPMQMDYMCGLLHDIGEARVYRILDEIPAAGGQREEVLRLVKKHHCRAGAEIAMAWRLPGDIVDACAAHHDEAAVGSGPVRLVMIADLLVETGILPGDERFLRLGVEESVARRMLEQVARADRSASRTRAASI